MIVQDEHRAIRKRFRSGQAIVEPTNGLTKQIQ